MSSSRESSGPRPPAASGTPAPPPEFVPNTPPAARSARELVARRLAEQARLFPDMSLAPLDVKGLDDRDGGLAHAIFDAVIRRWFTLEFLLDTALKTPLRTTEPALRAVLLSGAAQLLLLDRIPAHAVLNESVELAKRWIRPGAGGLVNAVLRKMVALRAQTGAPTAAAARDQLPLSDGRILSLTAPVLPAESLSRLAVSTSHPTWLLERWQSQFGAERTIALALHSLIPPPTILNTSPAPRALPATLTPHSWPGHHVFTGRRSELVDLLEMRPDIWVQDPASSQTIASVANLTPSVIIDACAGQGTKTRQLAATFPRAQIIASDTDVARFRTLASGFRGDPRVQVIPAHELLSRCAGSADLLLLDVPCSNSGVLPRRAEAKYRCADAQLQRLAGLQRQIIADTLALLRRAPRGRILYSTCSIDRDENQAIAEWAVREHAFRIEYQATVLPAGLPGDAPTAYHDGSYAALLA